LAVTAPNQYGAGLPKHGNPKFLFDAWQCLDCQKSDSWMAKVVIFMSYFDFENGSRFAY
jgi:hypothetical protein